MLFRNRRETLTDWSGLYLILEMVRESFAVELFMRVEGKTQVFGERALSGSVETRDPYPYFNIAC
ncbi:MAG: hypothetical protein NT123_25375, partial [Proteobacteria bacterium]|nr:hypothetical protein [Pseudomonadota bacterium]